MVLSSQTSHILVVVAAENKNSNRDFLEKTFHQENHQVTMADSAEAALNLCDQIDFDLLLLDVCLPVMNGFELAERLRNSSRTQHINIILITCKTKRAIKPEPNFNLDSISYIEKPINRDILINKVEDCLKFSAQEKLLLKHKLELQSEIKKRKQLETELNLQSAVFNTSSDAFVITNKEQEIIKVNSAFTKITGYSEQDILGKTPKILASGQHDKAFYLTMWKSLLTTGEWSGEIWNKRKDGQIYPEWERITAIKVGGEITHYLASFSDLSQHKSQEARIKYLSYQDHLTDLPNRPRFNKQVKHSILKLQHQGLSAALLYIDINDFKKFNDTMGHKFGDQILIQFSRRLKMIAADNVIISRFGGDEFVIWIDEIKGSHNAVLDIATRLALRIQNEFLQPINIDHYDIQLSSSIGVAIFPDDGKSCDKLIRKADTAMYQAKAEGLNSFKFFQLEMENSAKKRLQIELELRQALLSEELALFYQPQVDISTGKIIGAEALLRWHSKKLGLISPAEFIPIAETSGLILDIGRWVIHEACQKIKQWELLGVFDTLQTVSINISSVQFENEGFLDDLSAIIKSSAIISSHLDIELTETALINDFSKVCKRLTEIKNIGCRISIDDFGTGYSSLKYLSSFPLDVLKIDKCFVDDISEKPSNLAIVHSIVSMAKMLDAHIVAEGVENPEQLNILYTAGCNCYQGYLFNPALKVSEFEDLIIPNM